MRNICTPFLLLATSGLFAQVINTVVVDPTPLHECQAATYMVSGTAPAGISFNFIQNNATPTSISLVLEATGPTSGSTPFSEDFGPFGPYNEGNYDLTISLQYNGTITSTWTGTLDVMPAVLPNAGQPTTTSVCPQDAAFPLLSRLDGNPDSGGNWLDPTLALVTDGMFYPGTSMAGTYTYSFDLPSPCLPVQQTLTINYAPNSSAGADSTVTLCTAAGSGAVDLMNMLGGTPDPGGTWSGAGTTGLFTPGTSQPGDYVYTVAGMAPCPDPTATVTVIGAPPSNAGSDSTATFCYDEQTAEFSPYIGDAEQTGVWHGPSGGGIGFFGEFFDVSSLGAGVYTYIVSAPPCPADTSFLTVVLDGPPCTLGIAAVEHTAERMLLSPNPATDKVIIEIEGAQPGRDQYIELSDVNGKVVLRRALNGSGTTARKVVDLSKLAPGAYTVKLLGGAGVAAQRLMVR